MDRLAEFLQSEQRVRQETSATFGQEGAILEHALGLALRLIDGHHFALDHTLLRAVLISRAVGSLRCAWLSAAAGHPTQALTLARAALEDYATASWVAERPEDAELWLWEIVDDAPEPDRRLPSFSKMLERVGERNAGLPNAFGRAYGHLSEAAHPRAPGLQWNVQSAVSSEGATHTPTLLPIFDATVTASCLHFLLHFAALILGSASELYHLYVPVATHDHDDLLSESLTVRWQMLGVYEHIRPLVPLAEDGDR